MFVAFVFRVHGHPRVARDSLGSSGGNLQECPGLFHDFVAHLKQGALGGLHDHFFIREARLRYWAPVNHPFAAIDIAPLVERDESLQDCLRVTSIQRVYFAIPVTRGAELTELIQDDAAVLVAPFGRDLNELLATKVVAGLAMVLTEIFFDARLRGDTGVVSSREPEGGFTFLARAAHHDVL